MIKKLNQKYLKKILIIDAWKFSNSKDVPFEFAIELSNKIIEINTNANDSTEIKETIKNKIIKKIIPDSFSIQLSLFNLLKTEAKYNKNEINEKDINNLWLKIKDNLEPTIIFIDNLERLGTNSWDLLKAILKIQEFKNYLIVLPLNLQRLKNNDKHEYNEYPIQKYIDINYFELKQDYLNFLAKNKKWSESFINKLNLVFTYSIEGENLSIREVENYFKEYNINNKIDEYTILKIIETKIWPAKKYLLIF